MIKSEQSKELGLKWLEQLQTDISAAPAEVLEEFRAAVNPDTMGFDGREGIDDDSKSIADPV